MRKTCFLALLLAVLSPVAGATTTTYSGEAVVRSIAPTRVAVFLDTNGDHLIDNGFLLTTDIPMPGVAVHLVTAKLVFTDGYVRVTSENLVYDLQVAGYPDPPAAPKDSEVVTMIGSALVHSSGDSGCDIQRAHEQDADACYAYGKK
ncbi:MAG TPA: hypothetical protein VFV49_07065 [Thermoanaerobaculia bacterium]|nr:hypothetical protein [Thermoanaerobaculia bacterium]